MKKLTEFIANFSTLHSTKYRADIDGLRAVAVLSVLICHGFPELLPGGFIGVDIFFVISGYLISSILINDLEKGNFSLWRFYDRRVRRIFPALITVLVAALCIGWLILFKPEFQMLGRHVLASTAFSENFLLWSESSYFDVSSTSKPLLHLWSLAIEEQFYIVWPLVMYLACRGHVKFITIFVVLGIASFSTNLFYVNHDLTPAYYSPFSRGWELMVGACLAYLQKNKGHLVSRYSGMQSIIGAAMIILSLVFVRPEYKFPGYWAILPTVGTALMISAGESQWLNRSFLSFPPLVWVGLISYPLYLWHWVFLSFGNILTGHLSNKHAMLLILASFGAAIVTFLYIERPFRERTGKFSHPKYLLGSMVTVIGTGVLVAVSMFSPRLPNFEMPTRTEWDFLTKSTTKYDENFNGIYTIAADRKEQALLIGDSHLAQYAERISKVAESKKDALGAIMVVGGGCVSIDEVFTDTLTRKGCSQLRQQGYELAKESRIKTVVIGGAWNWYFFAEEYKISDKGKLLSLNTEAGRNAAFARLKERIESLSKSGKKVFLVLDNPIIDFRRLVMSARLHSAADKSLGPNVLKEIPDQQWVLRAQLIKLGKEAGAIIIDPFAAICETTSCKVTSETGQLMYKDNGHFNPEWSASHAVFIDPTMAN